MDDLKIDKKDRLILFELFNNSRVSLSVISKRVKIQKQNVKYRIEQLTNKKIINKNFAIVDMSKFNFLFYEIFIKLQGMPKKREIDALEKLKKHPFLGWLVSIDGKYSIHCAIYVKKPYQFHKVYDEIRNLFYPYIKEIALNMTVNSKQFTYPFFKDMDSNMVEMKSSNFQEKNPKLSKLQVNLLKILSDNSRMSLTKIASILETTEKTIKNNILKLEKDKIILNYSSQLHPGKSGYFYYIILVRFNKYDDKFEEYVKKIPELFYIVKGAGFYDIKLEFYVDKESKIYEIESELYERFGKVIAETNILNVRKEYMVRYFTDC